MYAPRGLSPPLFAPFGFASAGGRVREHRRAIVADFEQSAGDLPLLLAARSVADEQRARREPGNECRVMGWSDGGDIGLDLAMHHPSRIDHLVTFGANFQPDGLNPQDVEWNNSATADSFGPGMREGWTKLNPQPEHYEQAMNKILAMWRSLPRWSLADLHRIRAKTLIVAGDHDLIRRDHTEQLAHAIPGATLWIVSDANHGVMVEHWDIVNPRVMAFFAK